MSRKLEIISDVGPVLLGPLPSDALERLKKWPVPLGLVTRESDMPATWTHEQKASCVVVVKLIQSYLGNAHTLEGLLPGFQLIVSFSKSGLVNADARGLANELGIPTVDLLKKPAYLIRIDLDLFELIDRMSENTLSSLDDAQLSALLSTALPVNRKLFRWHILWMTVLLVFLHELGHVLRGHLSASRDAFAPNIPAGANLDLIDELDADVFSNAALIAFLPDAPAGIASDVYKFTVGALAGRTLFATLAGHFGPGVSQTHPAKPVRALWSIKDIGERVGIDAARIKAFFQSFDCRFESSDDAILAEQQRQAIAWGHWRALHHLGYFRIYFPV